MSVSHVVYQKVAARSLSSSDWLLCSCTFHVAITRFFTFRVPVGLTCPGILPVCHILYSVLNSTPGFIYPLFKSTTSSLYVSPSLSCLDFCLNRLIQSQSLLSKFLSDWLQHPAGSTYSLSPVCLISFGLFSPFFLAWREFRALSIHLKLSKQHHQCTKTNEA